MSKFNWTMDKTNKFIELYKKHECLWNNKSDTYKNCKLKKIAIEDIMQKMNFDGLTITIIKEKIRSIRTIYRRELNKIIKSRKNGSGDIYEPKLSWFKRVDPFLRSVSVLRTNISKTAYFSNFTDDVLDNNEDSSLLVYDNIMETLIKDKKLQTQTTDAKINKKGAIVPEEIECEKNNSFFKSAQEKQKCVDIPKMNERVARPENNISYERSEENEFDIFGKSVAAQLKQFPLLEAIECQKKIQDILFTQRILLLRKEASPNRICDT